MEEAIDIIASFSGEPRRLRQTSTSLRESTIQNDKNIYEGVLRKYNTSSIYKAAEEAIKSNDMDIISKLILQYSGQLPIPWNYLAQFVISPQMARLVVRKLDHINDKDTKSRLIGQFKLEDLYDQVDDKVYLCSSDEAHIQLQLYRNIFYCLNSSIYQNASDYQRESIITNILRVGNPQQLLDLGVAMQDIIDFKLGSVSQYSNIPWLIEHGIPLSQYDAQPESREYIVENGPFEEYLKIPTGYVSEIIRSPLSRVMKSNNQISLDIASRYPDARLYTPEQILKAIQSDLLFRDRYMKQKQLEAALDLVIDRDNAIKYIVSAFDTMNLSLRNALLQVLEIKGLHADWVNYYFGYGDPQKPAGLSNIFWKQLVTEAIKQNRNTVALRAISKSMPEITPEVASNMINFIEKSSLNIEQKQKLVNLIRSIGKLTSLR